MPAPVEKPGVRLAELVATLSLGTDLGMGQPMEHVLRQSLIALRLAERLGLGDDERQVVYYVGLRAAGSTCAATSRRGSRATAKPMQAEWHSRWSTS